MYYNNILETIGNTPMVKLNKVTKDIPGTILAKVETFNPGNSVKDRMALKMIEDAEKDGLIKPGGTIIEGTSGNTGMGLALACIIKGYKLICTVNDKQSKEKLDMLRAMGAEVIVCPTNVAADDPRSYYSVAERLNKETPNSFYPNQYHNLSNRVAHYESTGPEIWEQTAGKITHFVVGVGTGGTISGVAKYLKEQNPNVKILGIDTYGSVFKKYLETGEFDEKEIYPYITEGIGEDILPKNVDFDLIDHFEKVTDKDGALMTRRLAREEGIFVGYSAGSAVAGIEQMKDMFGPDDVVVVLFHDHGSRYVGKLFNDDWMKERGFIDSEYKHPTLKNICDAKEQESLIYLDAKDTVAKTIESLTGNGISQLPVYEDGVTVGSISESHLLSSLLNNPEISTDAIQTIMQSPFPEVDINSELKEVSALLENGTTAILVDTGSKKIIVTKQDLIRGFTL